MAQEVEISLNMKQILLVSFLVGFFAGGSAVGVFNQLTGSPIGLLADSGGGQDTGGSAGAPSPSPAGGSQESAGSGGVSTSQFDVKGEPVIGSSDAPVTIAYWGDFQCPFCKRFEQQAFPQIVNNYIKQGKVRFVFKDFAFLGPDSTAGSIASECAWAQTKDANQEAYWNWHSKMFQNQDGENSGWGSQSDIIDMTKEVEGVNADELEKCMNSQESQLQQEISEDQSQGKSAGISGTPGFVIYKSGEEKGQKIVGAQPYSRFESAIEQTLNGGGYTGGTQEADKTVEVSGTEYSFSPSTITVEKGQTVRIEFTNTGQIPHDLKIPGLNVGTRVMQPGQTDSFTFTAPESGTFPISFECSLPGHAANGMTGQLQTG